MLSLFFGQWGPVFLLHASTYNELGPGQSQVTVVACRLQLQIGSAHLRIPKYWKKASSWWLVVHPTTSNHQCGDQWRSPSQENNPDCTVPLAQSWKVQEQWPTFSAQRVGWMGEDHWSRWLSASSSWSLLVVHSPGGWMKIWCSTSITLALGSYSNPHQNYWSTKFFSAIRLPLLNEVEINFN